jgi:hypothetical protein
LLLFAPQNWKGKAIDGKLTKKWSLLQTGVTVDGDTPKNARIMMFTALSYLIVQGVAFAYLKDPSGGIAKQVEKNYALAGFIVCMALLLAYCVYQVLVPRLAEKRKDAAAQKRAEKSMMLRAHYVRSRNNCNIVLPVLMRTIYSVFGENGFHGEGHSKIH